MQAENWTCLDFSRRTDALAVQLGRDVGDLPEVLGFSRASLFAYRTGKARISGKAWLKLEQAERAAEIRTASNKAAGALTRRLAQTAQATGTTEEEKQALFEEWMDKEKMPMVEEIIHLRAEVKRLRRIVDQVRAALGEEE
jgi:polyhydroxyalkanoate synthesis regulator phasin